MTSANNYPPFEPSWTIKSLSEKLSWEEIYAVWLRDQPVIARQIPISRPSDGLLPPNRSQLYVIVTASLHLFGETLHPVRGSYLSSQLLRWSLPALFCRPSESLPLSQTGAVLRNYCIATPNLCLNHTTPSNLVCALFLSFLSVFSPLPLLEDPFLTRFFR